MVGRSGIDRAMVDRGANLSLHRGPAGSGGADARANPLLCASIARLGVPTPPRSITSVTQSTQRGDKV
ncbi:hypothetical protein Xvtw_13695 [Xanthomonas campestris pv. vitiswoodrowii]|nr:hypothetical protein Xvtw_13695 [Xanthomonas campestris pv. vitiswoodrowii]